MKKAENKILKIIEQTLEDNKAQDVVIIDLAGKTSIADYMVVASGTSQRHVASTAEYVKQNLKNAGYPAIVEGQANADWVLIDAYEVIVHIFKPEVREFYNLEKMWNTVAKSRSK